MSRRLWLLAILLAAAPPQTFRSSTEGVRVDVLVTEGRTPVTGLSASDFVLRDNGVEQRIASASLGDVPLSLVLALDASGSVEGARLQQLRAAVEAVAAALGGDDRAALLTFNDGVALPAAFADGGASLASRARTLASGGATSLYDAAFAAMLVRDSRPGRHLVLLLTDGRDTASWLPAGAVLDAAHRSDAVVYCVDVGDSERPLAGPWLDASARLPLAPKPRRVMAPAGFLAAIARETGGRVFKADAADAGERLVSALGEFKRRYLLAYSPEGVDRTGWHELEVTVKRRGAKVTARRGYQR